MCQLLRFSVLVSLVGLPLMLGARTVEERPKVLVSVFNKAGIVPRESLKRQFQRDDDLSAILEERSYSRNCLPLARIK